MARSPVPGHRRAWGLGMAATSAITIKANQTSPEDKRDTEDSASGALPLGLVLTATRCCTSTLECFAGKHHNRSLGIVVRDHNLDPAIRDKIDTARSLVATIHEARRI